MNRKTLFITQISLLVALELILAFTPLGFIMVPPVAITILHIPVIISGVLQGVKGGAVLGLVFGATSMIKATKVAVTPVDMAFSPFLASEVGGNWVLAVLLAVGTRVLFGISAALLFNLLDKIILKRSVSISLPALVATVLHTKMVLGFLSFFFKDL